MNYSVTVIEKSYRPSVGKWISSDSFQHIVEASSKKEALKLVRGIYPDVKQYRFGKVYKTDRLEGVWRPNITDIRPGILLYKD